jgi:hypothetical protein
MSVPDMHKVTTIKYYICSLGLLELLSSGSVHMQNYAWVLGLFGLSVRYFGSRDSMVV